MHGNCFSKKFDQPPHFPVAYTDGVYCNIAVYQADGILFFNQVEKEKPVDARLFIYSNNTTSKWFPLPERFTSTKHVPLPDLHT